MRRTAVDFCVWALTAVVACTMVAIGYSPLGLGWWLRLVFILALLGALGNVWWHYVALIQSRRRGYTITRITPVAQADSQDGVE